MVRKGAETPAGAALLWRVDLAKFDKSHFKDQPFSISGKGRVAAHQLKKQFRRFERELAAAEEALRAARETTPPSGRKRGREEESPAMSSAEKRARALGMFPSGVIPSPSM
jgi:hypothetical protein